MRLFWPPWPVPPGLEELDRQCPAVAPVPSAGSRPFWSVMVTTYNSGEYLRESLQSVLAQAQEPGRMQVEVVDGGSTEGDPGAIVEALGGGKIPFHRLPENRGPAHTFNACIERARGEWVHILHGDDMVLPGFYRGYETVMAAVPDAAMVVGQAIGFDERGVWKAIEGPIPPRDGILARFPEQVVTNWLAHFPSVVIRRSTYESVGGFCNFFKLCCDWDMWTRAALQGPTACVPRPWAMYRWHAGSTTHRSVQLGENVRETCLVVAANLERLRRSGRTGPADPREWRVRHADLADGDARMLTQRKDFEGGLRQAQWAFRLNPNRRRLLALARAWTRHLLGR